MANDIAGLHEGDRLPGALFEETLEPASPGARVVARFANGDPAAVASSYGRGKALTLGSYLGVAYEKHRDATARRFFTGLMDWAGVSRPVSVTNADAEVRILESGDERIAFVFNHSDQATEPAITLRDSYMAVDLVTGERVTAPFRKRLAPGDVWVVRLRKM
jgi:beta-galactosidase